MPTPKLGIGYTTSNLSRARFRFWHVEPLLNQAAELIDRCLRDRTEIQNMSVQLQNLKIQLEDLELQVAEDKKLRAELNIFEYEERALKKEQGALAAMSTYYKQARDYSVQHWQRHENKADTVNAAAAELHRANIASAMHAKELKSLPDALAQARSKRLVLQRQMDLREYAAKRLRELMTLEGEAFNFDARIDELTRMLEEDFKDAYDRMTVAREGMETLYGYNAMLPSNLDESSEPIVESTIWVRAAIRWLASFSQLDQEWTIALSVRSLFESSWAGAWSEEKQQATFVFPVPESLFSSHRFVRLRGLSAFLNTTKDFNLPWSMEVIMPKTACSFHGYDPEPELVKIDQAALPSCVIGRVESRSSARQPEVAGAVSLMNASPVAYPGSDAVWSATLHRPMGAALSFADVNDIELELRLVGRPF